MRTASYTPRISKLLLNRHDCQHRVDIFPQRLDALRYRCSNSMAAQHSSLPSMRYQWQEDVEDLEEYCQGGYHPLSINDELSHGRYRIVHKLGFGTHSTVWLAHDKTCKMYVAIKIAKSATMNASHERSILKHLHKNKESQINPGIRVVPSLLDHFVLEGPNGRHQCLVSRPSRCSLSISKEASETCLFPLNAARAMAAQLILGVNYLHSNGVVHAGRCSLFVLGM